MESLSPIIRNNSARRLSLELCQKFANNLSLKTGNATSANTSRRRASDAQLSQHSPFFKLNNGSGDKKQEWDKSPKNWLSPIGKEFLDLKLKTAGVSPAASDNSGESVFEAKCSPPEQAEDVFSFSPPKEKKRRKLSMTIVTYNVIPPTPYRRSSVSSSTPGPPPLWNKENVDPNDTHQEETPRAPVSGKDWSDFVRGCGFYGLDIKTKDILGRGSFGTVVAGKHKGEDVAVKVLRNLGGHQHLKGELHALSLPPHPHIVSVYEVLRVPPDSAVVIMEKMAKGNLLSLINDPDTHLPTDLVVDMSTQIASALAFCHSHNLLHLDVKPQNVLLNSSGSLKLADFGTSRHILNFKQRSKRVLKLDGTVGYKAPELFKGECPTEKCDVYSLAITMWHLQTREQPYMGETEHSLIYKVVAQGLRPSSVLTFMEKPQDQLDKRLEDKFVSLYKTAWSGNPAHRPNMTSLWAQLCQLKKSHLLQS